MFLERARMSHGHSWAPLVDINLHTIKRGGLRSETAPSLSRFLQSNVDDRDDPVVAINDDDLITNDEVHVPAPLGIDLDECRGNLYHPHAGWHRGAGAEGEVDV